MYQLARNYSVTISGSARGSKGRWFESSRAHHRLSRGVKVSFRSEHKAKSDAKHSDLPSQRKSLYHEGHNRIVMLILPIELKRFESLLDDIESERLPRDFAVDALQAFFSENPHLLMLERFDEHDQHFLDERETAALETLTTGPKVQYERFDLLPQLRYRTPSGRWATLVRLPGFEALTESGNADAYPRELLFSFRLRQSIDDLIRLENRDNFSYSFNSEIERLSEEIILDSIAVSFDEFLANLRQQIKYPRTEASTLWSPRIWTPREQQRQRHLVDGVLRPHLNRWATNGLCLEDLNPSEFEDLVAELLFKAGLKVYKVREAPQGGRDLIARGILVPGEEPIEMAVEVKHRRVVDRPEVQLALYQNRAYPALVFVTSGRFTAGVFKEKMITDNRFRLFLKDGLAVGDMMRVHFGLKGHV